MITQARTTHDPKTECLQNCSNDGEYIKLSERCFHKKATGALIPVMTVSVSGMSLIY